MKNTNSRSREARTRILLLAMTLIAFGIVYFLESTTVVVRLSLGFPVVTFCAGLVGILAGKFIDSRIKSAERTCLAMIFEIVLVCSVSSALLYGIECSGATMLLAAVPVSLVLYWVFVLTAMYIEITPPDREAPSKEEKKEWLLTLVVVYALQVGLFGLMALLLN